MLNEEERKELEALVEHEKRNLLFYVLMHDRLVASGLLESEFESQINFHLDRLIDLEPV